MRTALFARYSSKLQDELSLEAQISEMERFSAAQGWTVSHRYLLPETRSADVKSSPEFQEMLAAAKRREFQVLLVHKLDRFGRNREDAVVYKSLLRRQGIQVRSVAENLGDGIFDRLIEGILEVVAEFYSLNLGQETRKGQAQLTRNGLFRGGKVPWGLRRVQAEGDHFTVEVDAVRGPVMAEVFQRVARGNRTGDILAWVEEKTGERWSYPTFYTRIKNPIYYGLIQFGKTSMQAGQKRKKGDPEAIVEGTWAGLVPRETWDQAQQALAGRAVAHKRSPSRTYLLSDGVSICAKCGRPIIGGMFRGKPRYVCSGRSRRDERCSSHSLGAEELERLVVDLVRGHLKKFDANAALREYEASLAPQREESRRTEVRLRKALTEVRRKKANLLRLAEDGLVDADLQRRLRELGAEESELAEEVATCQARTDEAIRLNVALVRRHVAGLANVMNDTDPEELKRLLREWFRLTIDLKTGQGQLEMELTPSATCFSAGRSARTSGKTSHRMILTVLKPVA